MRKHQLIAMSILLLSIVVATPAISRENLNGAFNAKVVQSSMHNFRKNGEKYHRYKMRLKLTGTGKIITAVAEAIEDSSFDLSLKEILDNTRYGNFSIMQRGLRYIVVFATPANKNSAAFSMGTISSNYVQIDEENHSSYHNTSKMKKSFSSGNLEVQIGN
ncbi:MULTISPECIES: hypothetical protein [unclassified Maridesulfovibrio]|uniref:hypothetical protein n=1 Tax=unclassified Maridesulfovibrio TaxID=2794999 RepID=UPI003B40D909